MNKRIKEIWLAALRSGKYHQAKQVLRWVDLSGKTSFCCLGVLCDLVKDEVGGEWVEDEDLSRASHSVDFQLGDSSEESMPPGRILDDCELTHGKAEELARMNDDGYSFADIAAHIEAHL